MARLPECWVQISVKFSHYTQLMHRAVWVAVWPCLLVLWAPPQSPLQEIFPISDTPACLLSFQEIFNRVPWGWGWEEVMSRGYTHPSTQFSWWQWIHFLCLSTVFLPKNKNLMLTTVSTTAPRWEASFWLGSSFREKRGPHLDMPRA